MSPDPQGVSLVCPHCRGALARCEAAVTCSGCGRRWPVEEGVPVFVEHESYWGEVPQHLMRRVLARSREIGWRAALKDLLTPGYSHIRDYVEQPCRADWRFLLPDMSEWTVLDVGAGWGSIGIPLARVCRRVVCLENIRERAQFIRLRAEQEGASNLQVLCADVASPPLGGETFDLVVMNGVVEWLGLEDVRRDPRVVQTSVLSLIRGLLRPKGHLYVGIENRVGYTMFLGSRDHSGVSFTSLMPRQVANWYLRLRGRSGYTTDRRTDRSLRGYRTYTYSARGYRKLLAEAGYREVDIYCSMPSYNQPLVIVPADDLGLLRYYFSRLFNPRSIRRRWLADGVRFLSALGLGSTFTPCFSILARV